MSNIIADSPPASTQNKRSLDGQGEEPEGPSGREVVDVIGSYLSSLRRTISAIQVGAKGDVQFGGVG
jgi:hypothetical protein